MKANLSVVEIKITGNKAFTFNRIQVRWFPIKMSIALEMIETGKAKLVEIK